MVLKLCEQSSSQMWRINPLAIALTSLLVGIVLTGCGKTEDKPTKSAGAAKKVEFDACTLLAEADPAFILGEPVGEANRDTHNLFQKRKVEGITISHCIFSAKSSLLKSVTLMIKHVANKENPTTGAALMDTQRPEVKEFEMEAEEIAGLGDVAVRIKMPGSFQLWVFWKKHFQMNVQITEMKDEGKALTGVKRVAQLVLSKL